MSESNESSPLMESKTCSKCHLPKPLHLYNRNRTEPDGHERQCLACRVERRARRPRARFTPGEAFNPFPLSREA